MDNTYKIFIISGGTGRNGKQLVNATLTQFNKQTDITLFTDIAELKSVKKIMSNAKKYGALVAHTLVDHDLRFYINNYEGVVSVDLMGDIIDKMSVLFSEKPSETPGLFSKLNKEYFQRIDAVQFTFKHDDGARVEDANKADIILLGVSRTFKTPLSVYLAYKGFFVINIPIVKNIQPPKILNKVDPSKVFCLNTNPHKLSELRSTRNERLGDYVKEYADVEKVREELNFAMRYYTMHSDWNIVRVTGKPIEEIASEILDILKK